MNERVLELAPFGIFIFDFEKQIHTFVNQKQSEITGYTLEDLQEFGRNGDFMDLFHPDETALVLKDLQDIQQSSVNEIFEAEYRYLTKGGSWVWLRSRCSAFSRDKQGKPTAMMGFFSDITELKNTELELRTAQNQARQYLNIAEVMLVGLDTNRRITMINPKGCRFLGYEEQEVIGQDWFKNFLLPEETDGVNEVYAQIMAGNLAPVEYFESHIICKGGSQRLMAWHNSLVHDEQGRITGILSSGQDITEQKANEERAKQAFEQMVTILDGLEVVVYVADMETYEILYLNEYTKKMFGDVTGNICWQEFSKGATKPCDYCTNNRLTDDQGRPTGPLILERLNNKVGAWFRIVDKAITWVDGRIVRLEIATDINDIKKAEEEKLALIQNLETALNEVKTLRGIIPICSYCKKIRNDQGSWDLMESYIEKNSGAAFSHGICPSCRDEHFPEFDN